MVYLKLLMIMIAHKTMIYRLLKQLIFTNEFLHII